MAGVPLPPLDDTICAIATAPGRGAIGIVRLSGPEAHAVAGAVFQPARGGSLADLPAGRAAFGRVVASGELIDEGIALSFRAPASYTGQDLVELQTHGGPAVLRRTLDLCLAAGARLAGPGEFTLRAYSSGRLDLAQAEAVLELVEAQGESARRNAALGLSGALGRRLAAVQDDLLSAYAALQATIDYPEEGVPDAQLGQPLRSAASVVAGLLSTAAAGRLSRNGARLALLGRPNVGKSSLLNALLGYQRSIVSPTPGTTRDYLEAPLTIEGVPITAVDTAGIRRTEDEIEASGVSSARQLAELADLRLLVVDGSQPLDDEDRELLSSLAGPRSIVVVNKTDLAGAATDRSGSAGEVDALLGGHTPDLGGSAVLVSALTGAGLDELRERVVRALLGSASGSELWITNERHAEALTETLEHIEAALAAQAAGAEDMIAFELQDALVALGQVTGRSEVSEETLVEIFSRFCVGK